MCVYVFQGKCPKKSQEAVEHILTNAGIGEQRDKISPYSSQGREFCLCTGFGGELGGRGEFPQDTSSPEECEQ